MQCSMSHCCGNAGAMTFVDSRSSMAESDHYLLGRREAEEARLRRQVADLAPASDAQLSRQSADAAPDSDAQLEKIGIKAGERILDLGCGNGGVLHLLGKRVGPT